MIFGAFFCTLLHSALYYRLRALFPPARAPRPSVQAPQPEQEPQPVRASELSSQGHFPCFLSRMSEAEAAAMTASKISKTKNVPTKTSSFLKI